jgi:hypothetical protein
VPILVGQISDTLTGNLSANLGNLTLGLNLTEGEQISPQLIAAIINTITTIAMITAAIGIAIGIACFVLASMGFIQSQRLGMDNYFNPCNYLSCI